MHTWHRDAIDLSQCFGHIRCQASVLNFSKELCRQDPSKSGLRTHSHTRTHIHNSFGLPRSLLEDLCPRNCSSSHVRKLQVTPLIGTYSFIYIYIYIYIYISWYLLGAVYSNPRFNSELHCFRICRDPSAKRSDFDSFSKTFSALRIVLDIAIPNVVRRFEPVALFSDLQTPVGKKS